MAVGKTGIKASDDDDNDDDGDGDGDSSDTEVYQYTRQFSVNISSAGTEPGHTVTTPMFSIKVGSRID